MKRDMNLIRLLLLQHETGETPPEMAEYDEKLVLHNIALMLDAKLIDGFAEPGPDGQIHFAIVNRLTWAGHDFLDSARDLSIWKKATDSIIKPGLSWSFSILAEFLKAEARRRLGSALGMPPPP